MANYSFTTRNGLPEVEDGQGFKSCNFCQKTPHTEIFAGVTNLVFKECNLMNCDVPADATVEDCLHIHKQFCSHNHTRWVERGLLAECADECEHMVSKDEVKIDGILVDTIYVYEDALI